MCHSVQSTGRLCVLCSTERMAVNTPVSARHRMVKLKSYGRQRQSTNVLNGISTRTSISAQAPLASTSSLKDTRVDSTSTKETDEYLQHLIRKTLFPSITCANYQDVLPSLTSSNAVDIQLYSLIGLLIKAFIVRWYSRLTDDQEFLNELIGVISYMTRNLETRIRKLDLELLLLDDLPFLLDEHLKAYRDVHLKLGSTFLPHDTIDKGFDSLKQHIALNEVEKNEHVYLKILSRNVVGLLLPEDENNSRLARIFVQDLLGDLLLRSVTEKLIQPYQIFEILSLICGSLTRDPKTNTISEPLEAPKPVGKFQSIASSISHFIAYTTSLYQKNEGKRERKKVASFHIFTFLDNFFMISSHRPVLYSCFKAVSPILKTAKINNLLSNLLQNTLMKTLKSDSLYAVMIRALRNNLFPTDEDMGPPRIEPTSEEFEIIRETTKNNLKKLCGEYKLVSDLLITPEKDELDDILDDFLTSFENKRINKHMIIGVFDLLVSKVFPELTYERD